MEKELNIKKIKIIIVNVCFLLITLILIYNKDIIKNIHIIFILVLLFLLFLKNILLKN